MSVGILILSHSGIGSSLLGTAMHMITDSSMNIKLLTVERDCEPDELIEHAKLLLDDLDTGDGVLMLTDLYGSTPSNIAMACAEANNISAVAGLNLSMLIKIMNYPELGLAELVDNAISGGKDGIIRITNTD